MAVIPRRYRIFLGAGVSVALGLLLIAFLDPDPPGRMGEYVGLGIFFGTMFGHTTLASAWTAFGPAPLVWRLPLSLVWLASISLALVVNIGIHGGPSDAVGVVSACLLGQWLLVQAPLWGLAIGYGVRLRHRDDLGLGDNPRERQFGIRQLMIITAVVGVAFGIGRIVVADLGVRFDTRGDASVFVFLAVAAIVITVPLLLAALLPRLALPAVLLTLLMIALATALELPMIGRLVGRGGPDAWHFVGINVFTSAWILAIAGVARINGYSLAAPGAVHWKTLDGGPKVC